MTQLKYLNLDGKTVILGDNGEFYKNSPTLNFTPNLTTIKDPDGNPYKIGQTVRVPASLTKRQTFSGYLFYRLLDIRDNGDAIWSLLDEGTQVYNPETLTVHIESNLPDTEDLYGTIVYVDYSIPEDENPRFLTQTYLGLDLIFLVPAYNKYSVEASNKNGYKKTGDGNFYTSQEHGNNLVTIKYESEKIHLTSNLDNVTYLINNEECTEDYFYVAYDTVYTVTGKDKEGYTVYSQTFTANLPSREIYVEYYPDSEYTVNISSNQPSYQEDIAGAKVTVNDIEYSHGDIVKIPHNTEIRVTTVNINGYSCTYSIDDAVINVVYKCEVVSITCNINSTLIINSEERVSYTGSAIIKKIPFDTSYTVTGQSVRLYKVDFLHFIANLVSRNIIVTYTLITSTLPGLLPNGTEVFPVNTDCIAVIIRDPEHNIEFAIGTLYNDYIQWGVSSNILPSRNYDDRFENSNVDLIYLWYNSGYTGLNNTDTLVDYNKSQGRTSSDCAAIWASEQILLAGDKELPGYLPSCAEALTIKNNYEEVMNALLIIGSPVDFLESSYFFAMSESKNNYLFWTLYTQCNEDSYFYYTSTSSSVLPIFPLTVPFEPFTLDFGYSGNVQSVDLKKGTYRLQCWGAEGGAADNYPGGKGGYSEGYLTLTQPTTLHVFVGGKGNSSGNGGWNGGGGGSGSASYESGGIYGYSVMGCGGGATDISLVTSSMPYSSNRTNRSAASLLARMIVAGGGGGGAYTDREETIIDTTEHIVKTVYMGASLQDAGYNDGSNHIYAYRVDYPGFTAGNKVRLKGTKPTNFMQAIICYYVNGTENYLRFTSVDQVETIPENIRYCDLRILNTPITSGDPMYFEEFYTESTTNSISNSANQAGYVGGGATGGGYNDSYKGKQNGAGTNGGFGYGANQDTTNYRHCSACGGGGWYGGGGGQYSDNDIDTVKYSGGGSGFVNTAANASYRPNGYTGLQLDSGATYAGTTSFEAVNGGRETGHSGNGYARITRINPNA